jgi:hypothetical protein
MVIITEDIIRKALNESIDEFMINEDTLNEKWGDSIKKVGNFLKNAAATYMDFMTDGQWNAKYGIYNNSTGKTTELYYLNQWFNWHVEQIQRLEERKIHPNDDSYRERSYKYNDKNEKIYTEVEDNYDSIEQYVKANIHAENFNDWIGKRIPNRQAIKVIDDYINEIGQGEQPKIVDAKTANYYLNIGTFQKLKGNEYFDATERYDYNAKKQADIEGQKKQAQEKQNQALQQDYKYVDEIINQIKTQAKKFDKPVGDKLIELKMQYVQNQTQSLISNQKIRNAFNSWIWSELYYNQNNLSELSNTLSINNFLSSSYAKKLGLQLPK